MTDSAEQVHHRVCTLCEAMCGLVIKAQGEDITDIRGDDNDPLSRGHVCPKAVALKDIHEDPDRLRQPMRRIRGKAGEFQHEPISWEEALDTVADNLVRIINEHGNHALGVYLGNPSVHNYGMLTHAGSLFKHIRTNNRFSATSVDQLPHHLVSLWLFGHRLLFPIPDIDRCQFFLMLGANPIASNGSIWTVPDVRKRIKDLTGRGGRLVVVDPRRTETAELASDYVAIKPGTDAALLLAMIHVLFRDNLVKTGHLGKCLDGVEAVQSAVANATPQWAEGLTGIAATVIEELSHAMAAAEGGICYGRMGVSVQRYGTLCQWAIQIINILTGNLDREGGSLFTLPAVDQVTGSSPGGFARHHSRVRGLPEFDRELPVSVLAEEITTAGPDQIKVLFTGAGNPVLSTPEGHNLEQAFEQLEFMFSLDPWINETTRHADIILPPTSPLEHDHYDLAFHNNAIRNTVRFNLPVFDKPEGSMHDWEIFDALGARVAARLGVEPLPSIPPDKIIDFGLRAGPYGDGTEVGLTLEKVCASPSGIDLGPLRPQLPDRLMTGNQRIGLAVPDVLADIERLFADQELGEAGYRLIGRRHVRDCNSWLHNSYRLVKGRPRCTVMVNTVDAKREGWSEGEWVTLSTRTGSVSAQLEITESVMPGVVSLPHGYGHGRPGVRADVAVAHAGISCNDITDSQYLDDLSGNAALNGIPVVLNRP